MQGTVNNEKTTREVGQDFPVPTGYDSGGGPPGPTGRIGPSILRIRETPEDYMSILVSV